MSDSNHPVRNVGAIVALVVCTACSSGGGDATPAPDPQTTGSAEPAAPSELPVPGGSGGDGSGNGASAPEASMAIELGDRPALLQSLLPDGDLKRSLGDCDIADVRRSRFSIAHRGAPLEVPEHSREGYLEAIRQGAGIVECDVTFTGDGELVCRHSQCDLHTTTNILATELADTCRVPPDYTADRPFADVQCCTSELTLAEFRTLRAKRDGSDPDALDLRGFLGGTPGWTFDESRDYATVMSFADSVALLGPTGVAMTPELKAFIHAPAGENALTRADLSARLFDELRASDIPPDRVFPQSFLLDDLRLWNDAEPAYAARAVLLDDSYSTEGFDPAEPASWPLDLASLEDEGVAYLAPPIWTLLTLDEAREIVPSNYATAAIANGLPLITWSLERGVDPAAGGGWYFQSIAEVFENEGDQLRALDVLARDVGVEGVFSDWPATTTWFDHCRGDAG